MKDVIMKLPVEVRPVSVQVPVGVPSAAEQSAIVLGSVGTVDVPM